MSKGVLHIRSTIGLYGAEQVLLNLATVSDKTNCKIRFFIIEGVNDESKGLRTLLGRLACEVSYIISNSRFDLNVIKKIREEEKYNTVVHTHDYKSLVLASIAFIFTDIKIVHHIHGTLGNTGAEKVYAKLERFFMRWVSKIITVSNQQKLDIQKENRLKNKVIQIDNGTAIFDRHIKEKLDSTTFKIVMVARFTPEKNHKKAIDIISLLTKKGYSLQLNLLGDGENLPEIKRYVNENNLDHNINFVGFTRDVKFWIESSHVMMLTSTTEGLPMSMLESMSYGVPIISTPVGEIPNILNKSNSGWLAENEIEFCSIISTLIDDIDRVYEAGSNAYDYSKKNLSTENQLNKILSVYEDITGEIYERCYV